MFFAIFVVLLDVEMQQVTEEINMLAKERQDKILSIIQTQNSIRIADIIRDFRVSHETARRDLDTLQDQNLIKRVHGGAVLADDAPVLNTISESTSKSTKSSMAERVAIGKAAAAMIKDGETVFLSVGLTVQQVAKALRKRKGITVLTNSVLVLNELLNTDIQVYVLGGAVNNSENNIEGDLALQTLSNFYVDISFISAGGVSQDMGISDYSLEVAKLNRHIIERSKKSVLLAHSKKFGKTCLSIVCPLSDVQTVITDSTLSESDRNYILENDIELILAKTK